MNAYTEIWRKGCTPPNPASWTNTGNNKAFLAQTVVMTANTSLSIPAALRTARPVNYERNAATIDWPNAANDEPLVLVGYCTAPWSSKMAEPVARREVRGLLAEEGWLAHWLDFAGDRSCRRCASWSSAVLARSSDPHRMRGAIQLLTQPHLMDMDVRDNEWRSGPIWSENVWGQAVHRVVTKGARRSRRSTRAIARISRSDSSRQGSRGVLFRSGFSPARASVLG